MADRPVRAARTASVGLHDRRDDGLVHGARGGPPRAPREGRLGRRAPGAVRGAGGPGRRRATSRTSRSSRRSRCWAWAATGSSASPPTTRAGCAPTRSGRVLARPRPAGAGHAPRRATSTPAPSTPSRRSSKRCARTAAGSTSTARSGCGPRADPARRHLVEGVGRRRLVDDRRPQVAQRPVRLGPVVRARRGRPPRRDDARGRVLRRDRGRRARPLQLGPGVVAAARGFAVWAALRSLGRQGVAELIARNSDARAAVCGGARGRGPGSGSSTSRPQPGPRPVRGPSGDPAKGDARTAAIVEAVQEDGDDLARWDDLARPARDADLRVQLDDDGRARGPRRGGDPAPRGGDPDGLNGSLGTRCAVMAATPRAARGPPTRAPGGGPWASAPRPG